MKYRTKPCEIEAIRYTDMSITEVLEFCEGHASYVNNEMLIDTLEGTMKASVCDYIIRGLRGEYYPCKPDVFEKKYEKIEEE